MKSMGTGMGKSMNNVQRQNLQEAIDNLPEKLAMGKYYDPVWNRYCIVGYLLSRVGFMKETLILISLSKLPYPTPDPIVEEYGIKDEYLTSWNDNTPSKSRSKVVKKLLQKLVDDSL